MFLTLLFGLVFFLFRNAFSINFLADDYFFLKIGRAETVSEFINFFSPAKNYFYRPLATEVFYWFTHIAGNNLAVSHLVVFSVYLIGIFFLYRSLILITKSKSLSGIVTFIYAVNFTHVFQLYYFGTFQEVAMFSFLAGSFFHFLNKKQVLSVLFFMLALMSKETAVFFPIFVFLFQVLSSRKLKAPLDWSRLLPYFALGIFFAFIYRNGLGATASVDNYKLNINPRMAANNIIWYFLWSLGLPNYMPDYMTSLFRPPIKEFWKVFRNFPETKIYFGLLALYLAVFSGSLIAYMLNKAKRLKEIGPMVMFSIAGFLIFIIPVSFFSHKWMVRLTVPLAFVSLFQGYVIFKFFGKKGVFRKVSYMLLAIYFFANIIGIKIHESSSTFFLESRISDHLGSVVNANRKEIGKKRYIYFRDVALKDYNPWGQSKHLKTALGDQNFIDLYFPKSDLKAIYGFEQEIIPADAFVINSLDLLEP